MLALLRQYIKHQLCVGPEGGQLLQNDVHLAQLVQGLRQPVGGPGRACWLWSGGVEEHVECKRMISDWLVGWWRAGFCE